MAMTGSSGLAEILNKTLDDLGLFRKARKYQVFSLWSKIVGDISRHAKPRRLQGDVLFVATASSVWSQELTFMQESIVARINQALGGQHIREVRFSEHLWGAQEDGQARRGGGAQPRRESWGPEGEPGEPVHPKGLGAEIADVSLLQSFRRTAGTMMRRRRYLLASGYKLCRTCGNVYPAEKSECPACKVKREFVAYNRAIAILDRRPELGNEELSRLADLPDPWLVERARRELESRLASIIRNRLGGPSRGETSYQAGAAASAMGPVRGRASLNKGPERTELIAAVKKLASLRSLAPFECLSPEDVEKAVGRRLSTLVKKE
jgi:hypothetical protein